MPGKQIWFPETGVCPYGHKIDECTVQRKTAFGKGQYVCRINERKRQREYKQMLAREQRERNEAAIEIVKVVEVARVVERPLFAEIGTTEYSGIMSVAGVQCVRGHWNMYPRVFGNMNTKDPGPLWCQRCCEWQKIHQVSNRFKDQLGMVYWPLEEVTIKVWKHAGSVGSGKA